MYPTSRNPFLPCRFLAGITRAVSERRKYEPPFRAGRAWTLPRLAGRRSGLGRPTEHQSRLESREPAWSPPCFSVHASGAASRRRGRAAGITTLELSLRRPVSPTSPLGWRPAWRPPSGFGHTRFHIQTDETLVDDRGILRAGGAVAERPAAARRARHAGAGRVRAGRRLTQACRVNGGRAAAGCHPRRRDPRRRGSGGPVRRRPVCFLARPAALGGLDRRILAERNPSRLGERTFFGQFVIHPDTRVGALDSVYRFGPTPEQAAITIGELLSSRCGPGRGRPGPHRQERFRGAKTRRRPHRLGRAQADGGGGG